MIRSNQLGFDVVVVLGAVVLALGGCSDDSGGSTAPTASVVEPGSGAATTTPPPTTAPTDPALELCLGATLVEPVETVADPTLVEASGLVASREHPGVLWALNDSGGPAAVVAVPTGEAAPVTATGGWTLAGATNRDWEDLAIGPAADGDGDLLYAADIGDNLGQWSEIVVYRFAEPDPAAGPHPVDEVDTLTFTYPDGAHDAETLLVDPVTGDLLVVAKEFTLGGVGLYQGSATLPAGATAQLERVGEIDLAGVGQLATGGDISDDGSVVAIRTYSAVGLWWRRPGTTVAEALLAGSPCEAPVEEEPQGETVALLPGGLGYVTISEGPAPPINRFERR